MFIVFPLLLSLRYYSEKYTAWIAGASVIAFTISAAVGSWLLLGILDLNFVDNPFASGMTQSVDTAKPSIDSTQKVIESQSADRTLGIALWD